MSIERDRITSLIEFAQHAARLRTKPVTDLARHQIFHKFEHNFSGLPGIHIQSEDFESEGEAWITINRLQESAPPTPSSDLLQVWLEFNKNSLKEPALRPFIKVKDLANIECFEKVNCLSDPNQTISLDSFSRNQEVQKLLPLYLSAEWRSWLIIEKLRRQTISIYSDLFSLRHQLIDGVSSAEVELVMGVGIAVWNANGTKICYPLITKVVEVTLNPITMNIEIRPGVIPPQLELDHYSHLENYSVIDLDKKILEYSEILMEYFSPFQKGTFEGILRSITAQLDPTGIYQSSHGSIEERTLPSMNEKLQVTNTWALFGRPKSLNAFIQDLERFKQKLKDQTDEVLLPPAVISLVTDPSDFLDGDISLPTFRGLSGMLGDDKSTQQLETLQNLYFPKPFNDEQVRIVQLLESTNGVVVQGPPGTGKTHTIANIICHYLALGKRVLVTSMKEPALAVLKGQLPQELQSLAICLLSDESDGMKQLEHVVSKMSAEIQRIDRKVLFNEIQKIEYEIDSIHANLTKVDRLINDWANKNLSSINLDDEIITPLGAAKEVISENDLVSWLQDSITIDSRYKPQFSESDIITLRDARRVLANDLVSLSYVIPSADVLPDMQQIVNLHSKLVRYFTLQSKFEEGLVQFLIDTSSETIEFALQLHSKIKVQKELMRKINAANLDWTNSMLMRFQNESDEILKLFEQLGDELTAAFEERKKFLSRPVFGINGIEQKEALVLAIVNLSQDKRPFNFMGMFAEKEIKKILSEIKIGSTKPITATDWQYVHQYIIHLISLRELMIRWNALAVELVLPLYSDDPAQAVKALETYRIYQDIKHAVNESRIIDKIIRVLLPNYESESAKLLDDHTLDEVEKIITDNLDLCRLSEARFDRDCIFQDLLEYKGSVVAEIREFLTDVIANPTYTEEFVRKQWGKFQEELLRLQKLIPISNDLFRVCNLIEESGALIWAEQLRTIPVTTVDDLVPENWSKIWRLKRLATHLNSIDGQGELKRLSMYRKELDVNLRRAYTAAVEKRVWLKIVENATPSIRSALMGYVAAILKIGKDKGKRAPRHRQDARNAAAQAFPAIPCWIMPHHRISQSLPPEFGCFDLVIIDEASQSDLSALPAMFRAEKVLIVGDDKQVSPEGVGIEEEEVQRLMSRFLSDQVRIFRPHMAPDCSIYDLFKVVFAKSSVMLKEHFRSVASIIEYSKREFYNHELKPLRIPKLHERLDPPLIDILVEDGFRKGNINPPEIKCIVEEIKAIVQDPNLSTRTIGVVSLLADQQAFEILKALESEIGFDAMQRHQIACGDAWAFQGKERDIMFLSMVVCPKTASAVTRRAFAQRFNVAASRARDRMYLVRSVTLQDLSEADYLRKRLIEHFSAPFIHDEVKVANLRELCESPFEKEIFDLLTERGYCVIPQVPVGGYRIDMVVEGVDGKRLAIECDGDRYHGPDQWENDIRRQRILERAGWNFWRCFASTFVLHRSQCIEELLSTIDTAGIKPVETAIDSTSVHTETRRFNAFSLLTDEDCAQTGEGL